MALRAPCPILLLPQRKFCPLCHRSCLFTLSLSPTPLVKAETAAGEIPLPEASSVKTPGKVSCAFFSLLISLQKFPSLIFISLTPRFPVPHKIPLHSQRRRHIPSGSCGHIPASFFPCVSPPSLFYLSSKLGMWLYPFPMGCKLSKSLSPRVLSFLLLEQQIPSAFSWVAFYHTSFRSNLWDWNPEIYPSTA